MRILVLRHGRTALNEQGIFNGQYDEPLSSAGRLDAETARARLASEPIDWVYCSPLLRTRETCEIALEGKLGVTGQPLPVAYEPRLMERSLGVLDGQDLGMAGFNRARLFDYDYDPALPGGFESWPAVFARVHSFLDEIIAKYRDTSDTTLLVTHAGAIRAIYYYFYPLPESRDILEPKFHNCEIAEFRLYELASGSFDVEYQRL